MPTHPRIQNPKKNINMPLNPTTDQEVLRKHLIDSLSGQLSHLSFEHTIKDFPTEFINLKVDGQPHSCWDLVEHMRIAQWDILDFIHNPDYQELPWPEGYWPKEEADANLWQQAIDSFVEDRGKLIALLKDTTVDLFAPIPHASEYTIFREIIVLANHHSYHTGQILQLRRALGIWP